MEEDGSHLVNLTKDPAEDIDPAVSADGSKIVFVSDRHGDYELYLMNLDGSGVVQITDDAGQADWPSWKWDGTAIAYHRGLPQPSPANGIHIVSPTGSGDTTVLQDRDSPTWTPDGHLAFPFGGEIFVANADGSNVMQLSQSSVDGLPKGRVAWSPDGSQVAFETSQQIGVMSNDGTGAVVVTSGSRGKIEPAWSPDGTQLIFACDVATLPGDVNDEVCVMAATGGSITNLTNLAAPDVRPTWAGP